MAYFRAVARFFAWCDHHKIGEIADIEPLHVAAYVEALGKDFEKPTVKQHLAAIRMLFDWLVTARAPKKYHEHIGTHAAHPGTGKGRQAVKMRAELEAADSAVRATCRGPRQRRSGEATSPLMRQRPLGLPPRPRG